MPAPKKPVGKKGTPAKQKFIPSPAPEELAPEIVKDQQAVPCPNCGQLKCDCHPRVKKWAGGVRQEMQEDKQRKAQAIQGEDIPGRFVVHNGNGGYLHEGRAKPEPFDIRGICIFGSFDAARKMAHLEITADRPERFVQLLEDAIALDVEKEQRNAQPSAPCRFVIGDNVKYKPGNEYDVGKVTDVVYNASLSTYVVTADLPRGSFRAPVGMWDFALPSETNPDFKNATYREAPTHHTLPTFPADPRDGSVPSPQKRAIKLMCWNPKDRHGFLYINDEGRCGVYTLRLSGRDIYSVQKQVLTAEISGAQAPYYVRLSRTIRGPEIKASCTCPGFVGAGHCRHARAIVKLVSEDRI